MQPAHLPLRSVLELSANLVRSVRAHFFAYANTPTQRCHGNQFLRHIRVFVCRVLSIFPVLTTERRHYSFEHNDDGRLILSEKEILQIKQTEELCKCSEMTCITQRPTHTPPPLHPLNLKRGLIFDEHSNFH
jgi:hypothetical protein